MKQVGKGVIQAVLLDIIVVAIQHFSLLALSQLIQHLSDCFATKLKAVHEVVASRQR